MTTVNYVRSILARLERMGWSDRKLELAYRALRYRLEQSR